MTSDNAMRALAVASVVPVLGAAAGAVRAGVAARGAAEGGGRKEEQTDKIKEPLTEVGDQVQVRESTTTHC